METTFSLFDIQVATQADWRNPTDTTIPLTICTDTRNITPGCLFIPIVGQRFDGHDYLAQAFAQGASAALVQPDRLPAEISQEIAWPNCFIVPNTTTAYLQLGCFHRRRCPAKVIGVAGSNGKTTTKEMLLAALSPLGKTQCTHQNHNNEIGVSQTLLSLEPDTDFLIVEMAMRGSGEIRLLTQHAEPDVAVILNIGPEHIEFFGTLEAIAQAECEILEGLNPETGIAVWNQDDALLEQTASALWPGQTHRYSLNRVGSTMLTASGGQTIQLISGETLSLTVAGSHNRSNAMAVLAVGEALGFSATQLISGIQAFEPVEGRGNRVALAGWDAAWVINDAYNANPDSMKASIETFLQMPDPQKVLILGGMKELGPLSESYHKDLGRWLAQQSLEQTLVIFTGEEAPWLMHGFQATPSGHQAIKLEKATIPAYLVTQLPSFNQTLILLKASRAEALETLIPQLSRESVAAP